MYLGRWMISIMASNPGTQWTDWKPVPGPRQGRLHHRAVRPRLLRAAASDSGELVLFGSAGHVAYRMCSLLPSGAGVRNNAGKRAYVGAHLSQIEYRVIALASRDEAMDFERRELWSRRDQYVFKT